MSTNMTGSFLATGATPMSRSCCFTRSTGLFVITYRHFRPDLDASLMSSWHRVDLPTPGGPIIARLKPVDIGERIRLLRRSKERYLKNRALLTSSYSEASHSHG